MNKSLENLIYKFYIVFRGIEPTKEDFAKTIATANYLLDNNYNDIDTGKIIGGAFKKDIEDINLYNEILDKRVKQYVEPKDLPDSLWEDSLLKRDTFYYSEIFHIKSNPPTWNPKTFTETCEPFFLEMKIKFTMDDLLDYFYNKCRVPMGLHDDKKNAGAFNHLIKKYDAFGNIPGIDYVIALINRASSDIDKDFIANVFEIEDYSKDVIKYFKTVYEQSELEKVNRIVWRS